MNLTQAIVTLQTAKSRAEEANSKSQSLNELVNEVKTLIESVQGSGISPQVLPSLIFLANEITENQEQQLQRIHSMLQGIDRVIG